MLRGTLVARYYYIYAVDYDRGGEWSGQAYMCSREKEFTIRGTDNCLARGFDRTGFFEVDTNEQRSWTVQLTESADQPGDGRLSRPARRSRLDALCRPARRWCHHRPPGSPQEMRRLRRAKIVATLGPSSSSADMIARLFAAGADVFRINMSHTSHDRMRELVGLIRAVEKDTGRPIGILVDLQGPKLRLGTFAGGSVTVKNGDTLRARLRSGAGRRRPRLPAASGNLRRRRSPATRC